MTFFIVTSDPIATAQEVGESTPHATPEDAAREAGQLVFEKGGTWHICRVEVTAVRSVMSENLYPCPCHTDVEDPGSHLPECAWADPAYEGP